MNHAGNLDNEVIFKKAFTDKFVLQCLVKDLFGVTFIPGKVETEKRFPMKISYIDFKYDVFAQSKDKRVIVEIQKVDYDSNFDRFLLYHNMAIAELQRSSKEYKASKIVYTIVVCTGKYVAKERNGNAAESAKAAYTEAAQIEAAIGIAKNLIAKGMDDTFISEVTNLNAIQIQALRKS